MLQVSLLCFLADIHKVPRVVQLSIEELQDLAYKIRENPREALAKMIEAQMVMTQSQFEELVRLIGEGSQFFTGLGKLVLERGKLLLRTFMCYNLVPWLLCSSDSQRLKVP